ncbi:MAG: hypothetical protein LC799_31950, partial [Actinobacteria bacterium]|nr:hypothetical protein [Actinomycetota bacterium]
MVRSAVSAEWYTPPRVASIRQNGHASGRGIRAHPSATGSSATARSVVSRAPASACRVAAPC